MRRPFAGFDAVYVRYWVAASTSIFGSSVSVIAFPLLVIAVGGSAAAAGAVATVSLVARTALRVPAGHVCDLVNPRTLMIAADAVRLVALGALPLVALAHTPSYPQILTTALVEGVATAFYQPAYTIMLRDLVPADLLTVALGRASTTTGAIAIVGPLAGGALFTVGDMLPFVVDAASYAISLTLLLTVRAPVVEDAGQPVRDNRVTAGLRWLAGQPGLLRVLVLVGVYNLVATGADVPVLIALRRLGASDAVYGAVLGGAGVGLVVGGLIAPRLLEHVAPARLRLLIGLVWVVGTAVFALPIGPWTIGILLAALMTLAPAMTIQLTRATLGRAPRSTAGRVISAQQTVIFGLSALGPGLTGVLLDHVDVSGTWLTLSVMCLLATALAVVPARPAITAPATRSDR